LLFLLVSGIKHSLQLLTIWPQTDSQKSCADSQNGTEEYDSRII